MTAIHQMAKEGHYPASIATCDRPVCVACIYGRAHKKPWRTKGKERKSIRKEKTPLDDPKDVTSSTDTFVSSVPGLIPQSTGTLMNAKYIAGTVFVDHETGLCYAHNQIDQTAASAIEAKEDWERMLAKYGK